MARIRSIKASWRQLSTVLGVTLAAGFTLGASDCSDSDMAPCADSSGVSSFESDAEPMFGDNEADAIALCAHEACIAREEAICLARQAGITDGSTGIKATISLLVDGEYANEDGSPVEERELHPPIPRWNVWNLVEDNGTDGRWGEMVTIDARTGIADDLYNWMRIH